MSSSRGPRLDARQGRYQVLLDVVVERLERRYVEDVDRILERSFPAAPEQVVDAPEEGSERLARAGGREDEGVLAVGDPGPRHSLRGRGLAKLGGEPLPHARLERLHQQ